jgi:hypothetical protein
MRYLSRIQYEKVLLSAFRQMGLADSVTEQLIAARWPMDIHGVVSELSGRGLEICAEDVRNFITSAVKQFPYMPQDAKADLMLFPPIIVEHLIRHVVEESIAKPTHVGQLMSNDFSPVRKILKQVEEEADA